MTSMKGQKININGLDIHYEKIGTGPHVVLLLPGLLGTTRTDFDIQLEGGLNQKKFTLIAWDPPGYGFSRPPERNYVHNVYRNDADLAAALMKELGHTSYSILGWSDGGKTALFLASKYPAIVEKVAVWGVVPFGLPHTNRAFYATKNMSFWDPELKKRFETVYGSQLERLWTKLVDDGSANILDGEGVIIPKDVLEKIHCPVFIMHGDKDPMVSIEHANHLLKHIPDSNLHRFPKASHNPHQTFSSEFHRLVTDFFLD